MNKNKKLFYVRNKYLTIITEDRWLKRSLNSRQVICIERTLNKEKKILFDKELLNEKREIYIPSWTRYQLISVVSHAMRMTCDYLYLSISKRNKMTTNEGIGRRSKHFSFFFFLAFRHRLRNIHMHISTYRDSRWSIPRE